MKTLSIRNSMNKLAVMAAAGMLATALLLPGAVAADNDDDNDFDFATVMISDAIPATDVSSPSASFNVAIEGSSASRNVGRSILEDQDDPTFKLIVNPSLLQGTLGTLKDYDMVSQQAATSVSAEDEASGDAGRSIFFYEVGEDDD